jgi:transposase
MGNPAGVKRDFEALEERRMRAVALLRKGMRPAEVARELGVARQSVGRWAHALEAGGKKALKWNGRAGRMPRLSARDLQKLARILERGPEVRGFASGLWTAKRVGAVIRDEFGVSFDESQVWRILQKMNWSCQRPTGRAKERDEEAILAWKKRRWPSLKKRPKTSAER